MPNSWSMTDSKRACPMCGNARSAAHSPFCSPRCRDRDLARWFGDGYAVPGRPLMPEEVERASAEAPPE